MFVSVKMGGEEVIANSWLVSKTKIAVVMVIILLKGKCLIEDDQRVCECDPGWQGDKCETKSCDYINMCGPHGNFSIINIKINFFNANKLFFCYNQGL